MKEYETGGEEIWGEKGQMSDYSEKQKRKKRDRERRKMRARKLMDQKANSVADMAFVLGRLGTVEQRAEERAEDEREKEKVLKKQKQVLTKNEVWARTKVTRIGLEGEGTGAEVEVLWKDLLDAEYAKTWSGNVVHGLIEHSVRKPEITLANEVSTEERPSPTKPKSVKKNGNKPAKEDGKKPEKLIL